MREDANFLWTQIETEPISLLLLNGRSVINAFIRAYGLTLKPGGQVRDGTVTTTFLRGETGNVRVIGWSTNLHSSFGVTPHLRSSIAAHLATLAG
jgi:hypothetical protein